MRKLLDRAKGVLQASRGISEPEAFRWIQKTSMDRRMTMRALAQEILAEHQNATKPTAAPAGAANPESPTSHADHSITKDVTNEAGTDVTKE
jgi:response regulator NasT